jgi:biopolymer transport protein ExbD
VPVNPWGQNKLSSEINVTPLADVTLSLLILFLVITPVILYSFTADLPVAGRGMATGQVEKEVTVAVAEDGTIQLDGEDVSEQELSERIAELFPPDSPRERKVVFDGNEKAKYDIVVHVMDVLRRQGIEAIGIR